MPCISSHQIRSSVPGFHSDGLLIWSYKYLRNIISPCFQPRGQRCVTKVKVLLYTLDAKAAEGSCSSIVTVPDISGEAWVAHLPDKTLRNNRDSSGETNQKNNNIKSNPSKEKECLVPVWCSRLSLRIHIEVESFVSKKSFENPGFRLPTPLKLASLGDGSTALHQRKPFVASCCNTWCKCHRSVHDRH